ncbi:hypothetical protein IFM58399_04004 [Aspergillus lentulus]|uniref:Uncharacterized protein n=1 Tax=Aspergillus lentulus TaxID=293939 RepID=A0ABQ1AEG8_ASPLE|nr:uncharacterized protein IFM58399_04004 [Aspergillus lentulus]GFF34820.1 hypothetical protein IFM58399_04004 [Aspergillus lentulus]GFF80165.1 hypothetical protein IFM60648_05666 [Aspergillus lentulus]GFF90808.1 hypothetical protein IFM47457_08621 [Aspergillus lentulus]
MKLFAVTGLLFWSSLAYARNHNFCACQTHTNGGLDLQATIYCCDELQGKANAAMELITKPFEGGAKFPGSYCGSEPAGDGRHATTMSGDWWHSCCQRKLGEGADSTCYW